MFFSIYSLSVHLLLQKDLIYQSQAKWIHNFPLLTQKEEKKKKLILEAQHCKLLFSGHLHTLWWGDNGRLCALSVCSGYSSNGQDEKLTKYFVPENSFRKEKTYLNKKRKENYCLGKDD